MRIDKWLYMKTIDVANKNLYKRFRHHLKIYIFVLKVTIFERVDQNESEYGP